MLRYRLYKVAFGAFILGCEQLEKQEIEEENPLRTIN